MRTRFSNARAMQPGQQLIGDFDPRSISGLQVWLDAADSNTITVTSGNVSQWTDKSSNAYVFSNGALTGRRGPTRTTTLNGRDVLTFTATSTSDASGQFLSNATPISFNFSSYTIAIVHKPTRTDATNYGDSMVVAISNIANNNTLLLPFPTATGSRFGTNAVASTYDTSTRDVSTDYNLLTVNLGTERLVVSRYGWSPNSSLLQGTSNATTNLVRDCSFMIGARPTAPVSQFFSGTLAEVLIYSNGLGNVDQRRVEGYLAWKWGLQSNLASTHPFARAPPLARPFLPTDIPNCIVWFDAADTATLTTSGTQVTSWRNKGTLAIAATTNLGTASTGFTFNTSSLNTVQFPSNCSLIVSNVLTTTPARTQFFIFTVTSYGDGYGRIFSSTTTTGNRQLGFNAWNRDGDTINLYPAAYSATEYLGTVGSAPYSGTLPYNATPFIIGLRHTASSPSNISALTNAISINGTVISPTTSQKLVFGYFVGNDTFSLGTAPYGNVQQIGEVIQYDRALTDSEMRRVEGYLLWKWNLVSNAPATHAYARLPPSISAAFTPALLPGCILWLDAADVNTLTTVGSSVTVWRDKSVRGNSLTFTSSPTTGAIQNGNNVLTFAGNYGTIPGCTINTACHTLFAVHRPSAASSNTNLFTFMTGASSATYVLFPYYATTSKGYVTSGDGAGLTTSGAGLPDGSPTTSYTLLSAAIASASLEIFSNGVAQASSTQTLTFTNTAPLTVGSTTTGSSSYGGTVGELIVFSGKLTAPQRQCVEGYLAKKWAI